MLIFVSILLFFVYFSLKFDILNLICTIKYDYSG